jgi:hypothetical protein
MSKDPKEIREAVDRIVERHMDDLYTDLDNLHRKNIDDNQVKAALMQLGYASMSEWYDEWMENGDPVQAVEIEEDGAPRGIVIDPIDASSYAAIPESKDPIEREHYRAEASVHGPAGWNIYKKRSKSDNGAFIGKWPTRTMAIEIINTLQKGMSA